MAFWGACIASATVTPPFAPVHVPTQSLHTCPAPRHPYKHGGAAGTLRHDFHPATFPNVCGRLHGTFLAAPHHDRGSAHHRGGYSTRTRYSPWAGAVGPVLWLSRSARYAPGASGGRRPVPTRTSVPT